MFKRAWHPGSRIIYMYIYFQFGLDRGLLSECVRVDVYATGRSEHASYLLNALSEMFSSRIQLKSALKTFFKRLILGLYILCTPLHCLNSKTKNVLVFSMILHFILLSFYLSISFLIGVSMTSVILSYLLVI